VYIACAYCRGIAVLVAETTDGVWPTCSWHGDCHGLSFRALPEIGPSMLDVVAHVVAHPGISKKAARILPAGLLARVVSWETIERCIRAGLIVAEGDDRGYRLTATELGRRVHRWRP